AVFSYLQFPKLRSVIPIRDAVARGATKSVFGYAAMAREEDGELQPRVDLVRIGRPTGPEEIDLGAGAFLLSADYAHTLVQPEPAVAPEGASPEEHGGDFGVRGQTEEGGQGIAAN